MKRALYSKAKHIGDSVILTSAIAALPEEYVVDVLCFKDSEQIFRMNPRVQNIYVVPRHLSGFARWSAYYIIIKQLLSMKYDFFAQFSTDWRGAILSRILKPNLSVARRSANRPAFWHNSYKKIADVVGKHRPTAEQDVDLLRKAGLYSESVAPAYQLVVPDLAIKKVGNWLIEKKIQSPKKNLVVIHAASRWKFKGVPNRVWVDLIKLIKNSDYEIVLSGSQADVDFNLSICNESNCKIHMVEGFNLCETAALYQQAAILIAVDTMSIHLASAMKTPVVAIFGPTDEHNWAPWNVPHQIVALGEHDSPSFACRPCGNDGCGGSKISNCLHAIDANMVYSSMQALIHST